MTSPELDDPTDTPADRAHLGALLVSMLKIGTIGFGGGSALIPVMEKELVRDRGFLGEGAYTLHTVIANITPGALPVKLAALAGGRAHGPLASLLAPLAVALPGALATVGLVAAFNLLGPGAVRFVEFAAVGITAFIIVLLAHYITKVMRSGGPRTPAYLAIMVAAWLATGANGLIRMVGVLVGQEWEPALPQLSAVGLVVAALVSIGVFSVVRRPPGVAAGPTGMAEPLPDLRAKARGLGLHVGLGVVALVVAVVFAAATGGELLGLVAFSTVTSFGGGEAYVGVADGFFVASGLVSPALFYGQIVPVANALPGPILVKVASGIGYAFGVELGGPGLGVVFALCAFAMSIGACCAVAILVISAWTKVARSRFMLNLGRYILPVICGLLLTTSVSMVLASAEIAERGGVPGGPVAWASLVVVGVMWWAQHRFRLHDLFLLGVAGATSLAVLLGVAG